MDPNEKVKLMDSGLARFRCPGGPEAAMRHLKEVLAGEGGRVTERGPSELVLDHSDAWRWRFICARLEPSRMPDGSEGYAASFREANSNTPLRVVLYAVLLLLCLTGAGLLPWPWLRLVGAIAGLIACLLLLFSPDGACLRRMRHIIQTLDETDERP